MIALQGRSDQEIETVRNTEILLMWAFKRGFFPSLLYQTVLILGNFELLSHVFLLSQTKLIFIFLMDATYFLEFEQP